MSNTIFYDASVSDDERRRLLFEGQLFVYTPRKSTLNFVDFAKSLIEKAFAPLDPEMAQFELSVEKYAQILSKLKPEFIHHPESKRLIREIFIDMDCDLEKTYFDVPKMRSSTSDNYLTTGIAYAWHPHRDTWYSAPPCQINWWIPIYDVHAENGMAFHPRYWNRGVENTSSGYNYYLWNQKFRGDHVAKLVKEDPRPLPKPTEEIELDPQIRIVLPAGGLIFFSGAQMHSSVPNSSGKTRFSIDFRVVNEDDVRERRGAPKIDEACTGTTMRDYLRATDHGRLSDDLIALYDDGSGDHGELVYEHSAPSVSGGE